VRVLLNGSLTFLGEITESGESCHMLCCLVKVAEPGRDMLKISMKPFPEAQKSIGPEGLDEALC
jgi:hypothetical protein